jgi:hypothetical protein
VTSAAVLYWEQIGNGSSSFTEVARRLQFVSEGVRVSPNRPGALSERKVCWPFISLTLLVRPLLLAAAYPEKLRITAVHHHPVCHTQCGHTLLLFTEHPFLFFFFFFCPSHSSRLVSDEIYCARLSL